MLEDMPITHGTPSGYTSGKCRCEECKRAHREQAARYKDKLGTDAYNARRRAKYAVDPAAKRAGTKRWEQANPEKVRAMEAVRRERHRERRNEYFRVRYLLNRQVYIEKAARWKRETYKGQVSNQIQSSRRRGAPYTEEARVWIESLVDPLCTYCGGPADSIDHIIPISKGGTGERENLTPACKPCNSRKHTMSAEAFLRRLESEKEIPDAH